MALLFCLFLFSVIIICCPSAAPGIGIVCTLASHCPQYPDATALLAFKNAIISDPLNVLSAWKLPQSSNCSSGTLPLIPPNCNWTGVVCDQSHRVVALQLNGSQLSGTISPSLAQLPFLRSLDLDLNKFSGAIPVELGKLRLSLILLDLSENQLSGSIPVELGMLTKLKTLYLFGNELSGRVPAALANCTALRDLGLNSNKLSGSIPVAFGVLNKLENLFMGVNELTGGVPAALANCTSLRILEIASTPLLGSIPSELGMLKKLETLYLWGDELTGGVPVALANCSALRVLELSQNDLVGRIPTELVRLNKLETLYLWGNQLTGGVPAALANLTAMRELLLAFNQLSGRIPTELGMLKYLDSLKLQQNQLTGGVPAALANCTALKALGLETNQLSGSIPVELGMLSKLASLVLNENELTGEMPVALGNCTPLTALSLGQNQLSGNIPDVFDTLSSLAVLSLPDNLFTGIIPPSLTRLEQLYVVELGGNAFVGTVPRFSSLLLNYLHIANNNLSGSIPESLGTLEGLVGIDLSHNDLSGEVPLSLGSLQQLTILNLSNNEFLGSIPSALGSCAELQILNLSHNKLTGNLPSTFASLLSLTKLDLSYNQLEGLVPNMKPFNDTTVVDLRDNPMLCGPIVNRTCNASDQRSLRRARSNLKWIVPLAIVVGLLLIVGIVIWWSRNFIGCIRESDHRVDDTFGKKLLKVSADELREATAGFSEANILGAGGVSTVYKAVLADGNIQTMVAVKVLKAELATRSIVAEVARLKREVELLAMVRHRNIVRVLGCCFNLDMQAIILELMPNGNLDTYLHGMQRRKALTKDEKLHLLRGIAQGLEYLHHWHDPVKTIVHCDVKPANVLLDEEWEPRVADFGIAKLLALEQAGDLEQSSTSTILLRGSTGYIPPEYAFHTQVSSAGDVYSFGVTMLEILTCKRPTEVGSGSDDEQQQTLMSLVQAAYPHQLLGLFETPDMTQDEANALAQMALSCTSPTPTQRPTMLQVVRALNGSSISII